MSKQVSERNLFIFWRYPKDKVEEVLDEIQKHFEIEEVLFLKWTQERVVENFQRFYAMTPRHARQKCAEAGTAPFLFVLVTDHNPVYRYRITRDGGFKKINVHSFDLKQALRQQDHVSLHATNDQNEFRRDFILLMGHPAKNYRPPNWDGNLKHIKEVQRDIVAAEGWNSLRQVFSILNEAVNYVILRSFDKLPGGPVHKDVDILVKDDEERNRVVAILDKQQQGDVAIGSRKIIFDLITVEDFYYDPEWCRRILRDRIMVRGFYIPSPEHHFFSLLYHSHIHRPHKAEVYAAKLTELASQIGLDWITPEWVTKREKAALLVDAWLRGNGYYLTQPADRSVNHWTFVARYYRTPVLYRSLSITKKISYFMRRNRLLRPLVPYIVEARDRLQKIRARLSPTH